VAPEKKLFTGNALFLHNRINIRGNGMSIIKKETPMARNMENETTGSSLSDCRMKGTIFFSFLKKIKLDDIYYFLFLPDVL
jgi:hypothetical protein